MSHASRRVCTASGSESHKRGRRPCAVLPRDPPVRLAVVRVRGSLGPLWPGWYYSLDTAVKSWYKRVVPTKFRTTADAAKAVGISRATLQEWIRSEKIDAPKMIAGVRLWTDADVARLKRVKQKIYQEGHPRKPKRKR